MPDSATSSSAAVAVSIGLCVLALMVWILGLALLADLSGSDAAGNAYAQAFAAVAIFVLWLLVAIIAVIAYVKGAMPLMAAIAAFVFIPASVVVSMVALDLLSNPDQPPFLWPIAAPALLPLLTMAYCLWALLPSLRRRISPRVAALAWGGVLVLCISIAPMLIVREHAIAAEDMARAKYDADLAALPKDAPLWDWLPFLDTRNDFKQSDVLEGIGKLARRQSDAETMLERGDFPLGYLGRIDLKPTPAVCDKARALLRKTLAPLVLKSGDTKPYRTIYGPVAGALAAMNWLSRTGCDIRTEAASWHAMAEAYSDFNYDVYELRDLKLNKPQ
jgi:ABC-type transport system involved in multi-copper enzyme maturation permease subunit